MSRFTPHHSKDVMSFVEGDCKSQLNWELQSLKLKWHMGWDHRNVRNADIFTFKGPVKIAASSTLLIHLLTVSRLPVQSVGWLIFRNMIIGTPIINGIMGGGIPGRWNEPKNSAG